MAIFSKPRTLVIGDEIVNMYQKFKFPSITASTCPQKKLTVYNGSNDPVFTTKFLEGSKYILSFDSLHMLHGFYEFSGGTTTTASLDPAPLVLGPQDNNPSLFSNLYNWLRKRRWIFTFRMKAVSFATGRINHIYTPRNSEPAIWY